MPDETLLLPTKLHPPARQAGSLLRTRLVDALLEQSSHKLQLVIAPAGYGKTTLLTDFVADAPFPVAWLTLDPADRDPHSFVEYLVAALRQPFPACGEATLRMLGSTQDIGARSAALARTLAADVYANIPALCLVVLDDFQEVNDSAAVTGFLDELLRLLPENLRVLISSRAYPNLSVFSRLAVEQQLAGIGEPDLRFTGEEVRALFQSRYAKELSAQQAEELASRSEGWIAGLLLSAHGVWDGLLERVIETRGERGPVYDYLADAAYTRQPPGLRRFLLASSVPRTVDVATCEALLGPGPWLTNFEEAERANLFLSRLPGDPPSFRYHQLFREFLQNRLHREQPEEYRRLHIAAAQVVEDRSEWPLALEHYQEAAAHAEAASLISRIAPQLEREGRWYLLARSIDALPEEVRRQRPELLVSRSLAAIHTGDLQSASSAARSALDLLDETGYPRKRAEAFQVLGRSLRALGRTDEAVAALETALRLDPSSDALRAEVERDLGISLGVQGKFEDAAEHLKTALAWFEDAGAVHQAARTELSLGTAYSRLGQTLDAAAYYQRALDRWRDAHEDTDEVAIVFNNLGYLRYLQGDPDAAQGLFQEGLQRARAAENRHGEAMLEGSVAGLLLSSGDHDGARTSFQRALSLAEELGDLWTVTHACEGIALSEVLAGAPGVAESWLDRAAALAERQRSPYLSALVHLDRALRDLRTGRTANALSHALDAAAVLRRQESGRDLIRLDAIEALARARSDDVVGAIERFQAALERAESLGLPGLLDLPASFDRSTFASLDAGSFAAVRDATLRRIDAVRKAIAVAVVIPEREPLPQLRVCAFGRGEAWFPSGEPVDWGREKARELFFYLLLEGPVRSTRIIADLWPETSSARARAGFDSAAYALRRRVHADVLKTERHQYMLNPDMSIRQDVAEFDALLERAEQTDDLDEGVALLDAAVKLYTAPLLQEMTGLWAEARRVRYERRTSAALGDLARSNAARADWRASLIAAERALELEPKGDLFAVAVRACVQLHDLGCARRLLREWRRHDPTIAGQSSTLFQSLARETARLAHFPA